MPNNVAPGDPSRHRPETQLETVEYLMWRTNKPRSSAYAMVRDGRVPGVVRVGRSIRIDRDKLEAWIVNGGDAK